jgi:hypothetical protein
MTQSPTLELLRQAQQNMTVYQSQSYQKIQQQQQDLYEWRQQEMGLLKAIQLQQSDLWTEITDFQVTSCPLLVTVFYPLYILQGRSAGNLLELMSILQNAQHKATDIQSIQQTTMEVNRRYVEEITQMWDRASHAGIG